jgi:two-component system cell cycle response regulator DivK
MQPTLMSSDPATWNVLITDDEPDSIGVVQHVLVFYGAKVRSTSSGAACIEQLRQEKPHILFLDIQMPKMSGWDVLKYIRADDALGNLMVVALTAHAMAGDREQILAGGFDGYFSKPISPMSFIPQVQEMLQQRSRV